MKRTTDMNLTGLTEQLMQVAKKYYNVSVSEDVLDLLIKKAVITQYQTGDVLCEVGDVLNKTGFVLDGIIRSSFLTYGGKDITRYFHTKYSMVMDDCMLGFSESKYRCEVIRDAVIMMFDANTLKGIIKDNAALKEIYTLSLESGLRYKLYRENELMTKNALERYLQFVEDFPDLAANVKQRDIATYLGIEPQSLSRIKRQLKN